MLSVKSLSKKTGNTTLLPTISFQIDQGQCVVIHCNKHLGNTLIKIILGEEVASKGHVYFKGNNMKGDLNIFREISVCLLDDGLYERLKVKEYLAFFQKVSESDRSIDEVVQLVGLLDKKEVKIAKLTFSEKRRLQIGRVIINNYDFVVLEEPEQNVDIESAIIIRNVIRQLQKEQKAILITTSFLEDALSLTNEVYWLNEEGMKKVEVDEEESEHHQEVEEPAETLKPMKLEKIPAKVKEKVILFDPPEIHYIESQEGVSHLHLSEGSFPCSFTLNDLEEKLKAFGFFRCHRSYIVNLQRVREVITWTRNSYSLVLDDDKKSSIPLSKARFDELKEILGL
ncbi:LytTR family transcriptional regulator DNA-binding domain-containing protein [Bacillus sp. REN10]|uniref:LytTR family transcriptional regulator DNA-binding domain-containing protein n=1 Tax=Bacillus sp. REN10 TaxID=2782541 RepID=UPI001EED4DEA|nr:LytTR family transcriptional regulator DNA-binding domain-containing protein [Bacillus sp. REN10]